MRLSLVQFLSGAVVLFLAYRYVVMPAIKGYSENESPPADQPKPKNTMPDFDGFLLDLPVIGEWYERFRKDTYYRHDTRMMYLTLMTDIVKMKVEEVTAAKGVKLIQSYERSPILKELYEKEIKKPGEDATNT